jgi:hypothetical protein
MPAIVRDGGVATLIVTLFGLIALVDAALIAWRPDERKLAFLRAMSLTLTFATVSGFTGGVAKSIAGCKHLPPARQAEWPRLLMLGIGESLSVVVMGSTLLALAWFVAAIGVRRRSDEN